MNLRNDILKKAGREVESEFKKREKEGLTDITTDGGKLVCRKILFLSWNIDQSTPENFYACIRSFVRRALEYAIKNRHTSIAFPAIGCGEFKFDRRVIAEQMLVEAQTHVLGANMLLQIYIAIESGRKELLNTFSERLDLLRRGKVGAQCLKTKYRFTSNFHIFLTINETRFKDLFRIEPEDILDETRTNNTFH